MSDKNIDNMMAELYDYFLEDLLAVLKSGKVRPSDRAVIRQFLKDHGMANRFPNHAGVNALVDNLPHFKDDEDPTDCV